MVFSSMSGLMPSVLSPVKKTKKQTFNASTKHGMRFKRKGKEQAIGCTGVSMNLKERVESLNPYSSSCSLKCRHPINNGRIQESLRDGYSSPSLKTDKWVSELIYKRYTETDSRPLSPNIRNKSGNEVRSSKSSRHGNSHGENRKCITPEPETKLCKFHQRRTLVLDLRRVKSVDVIPRQGSTTTTTGTSIDGSINYLDDDDDDDYDNYDADDDEIVVINNRTLSNAQKYSQNTLDKKSKSNTASSRIFGRSKAYSNKNTNGTTTNSIYKKKNMNENINKKSYLKQIRSSSPITYERPTSPKLLEGLTLPPLHSSVLTLLGQRASSKLSPISGLIQPDSLFTTATPSKNKGQKLRRHSRKPKRITAQSDEVNGNVPKPNVPVIDSPENNFKNVIQEQLTQDCSENEMPINQNNHPDINQNKKSLQEVLDEYLIKNSWHMQDSKEIEKEIANIKAGIRKNETKLTSGNISLREDVWLSFPKTWSNSTCTFQAPTSCLELKSLTPLEYLRKYVLISQPRKHLYNLVFERYRAMENPLGTEITAQVALKAIAEVMGQVLKSEESQDLFANLLNIESQDYQLDQETFAGVCAVCERIFGKYSIDQCDESGSMQQGDKTSKSQLNERSQIERADLKYLATKVLDKQVEKHLAKLLNALCKK